MGSRDRGPTLGARSRAGDEQPTRPEAPKRSTFEPIQKKSSESGLHELGSRDPVDSILRSYLTEPTRPAMRAVPGSPPTPGSSSLPAGVPSWAPTSPPARRDSVELDISEALEDDRITDCTGILNVHRAPGEPLVTTAYGCTFLYYCDLRHDQTMFLFPSLRPRYLNWVEWTRYDSTSLRADATRVVRRAASAARHRDADRVWLFLRADPRLAYVQRELEGRFSPVPGTAIRIRNLSLMAYEVGNEALGP